jgi:hypothetical protein
MAFRDSIAKSPVAARVTSAEVVGFRLAAQHLTVRLPVGAVVDAAGACAVQNSPPGSALVALHARVQDITPECVDRAVAEDKSLLQSWSMRGAPFYFPTADAAVFTMGVMPATQAGRRHLILGVGPALDTLGMSLDDVVGLIEAEIRDVLSGRRLAIDELGVELANRVAPGLSPPQRVTWRGEGPYAAGQPLGEAVAHFCVRVLTLRGVVCLAPRSGNTAPFTLVEEWLGRPLPDAGPETARGELLRRYLRCYGPSTPKDFAAWVGVSPSDTAPWWDLLAEELAGVETDGRRGWILAEDLDTLRSPPSPRGLRLLPPHDPFTQARDRETLAAKQYHRDVWKPVGDPGAILADGQIAGIWRPRKSGPRLSIEVTLFAALTGRQRTLLGDEAEHLASLRGATLTQLDLHDPDADHPHRAR